MTKQIKPYSNKEIAVISNQLAKASYSLSVTEHRLIKSFLKRLDDYFDKELDTTYTLTIQEYAEDWGIASTDARKEAKAATVSLFKKKITVPLEEGGYLDIRWIAEAGYSKASDSVILAWSPRVKKHISQLKERFTKLDLAEMKDFSSSYTFRLYEIIQCSIGENGYKNPNIKVKDLMTALDVPESYKNYMTFNARVLTPCVKELNTKIAKFKKLKVEEHKVKGSKKVESIEFQGCGIGNRYK